MIKDVVLPQMSRIYRHFQLKHINAREQKIVQFDQFKYFIYFLSAFFLQVVIFVFSLEFY